MGVTSLIGGIITSGKKKKAAKKQARAEQARIGAEREKQRIEQLRANVQVRKQKRKTLREARIRKAQVLQAGINSGVGAGTSTIEGALGGLRTQTSTNIGALNEAQGFSSQIGGQNEIAGQAQSEIARQQGKIQKAEAENELFQSIGSFEKSVFGIATGGSSASITSLFGSKEEGE